MCNNVANVSRDWDRVSVGYDDGVTGAYIIKLLVGHSIYPSSEIAVADLPKSIDFAILLLTTEA
jgi:hypothetical protein